MRGGNGNAYEMLGFLRGYGRPFQVTPATVGNGRKNGRNQPFNLAATGGNEMVVFGSFRRRCRYQPPLRGGTLSPSAQGSPY
jgi:hypothetical protein